MEPRERYERELSENRQQRETWILETAERLFTDKGIEKTTMHHIAEEAGIGIATLFRYFPKKEKLIVAVATGMLETVYEQFQSINELELTCLEKLEKLFDYFAAPLSGGTDRYTKFLENFDSYAAHAGQALEGMEQFNVIYRKVSAAYSGIIEAGIKDGSIRSDIAVYETLTTVVNNYAIFAKKLSQQRSIMQLEPDVEADRQLALMKRILLDYLKAQ
ncbi:TetR/AcrR family transcriptional regulator [Paenibacillus sp. NPDC058071]|uniref:TetR/AcrR family transcriptional regulator n=1 Tax=Paenibacillus sp. NPDC058071 TaxID=3346326 RepID=UPI0036DD4211